jgi:hypothetical protein
MSQVVIYREGHLWMKGIRATLHILSSVSLWAIQVEKSVRKLGTVRNWDKCLHSRFKLEYYHIYETLTPKGRSSFSRVQVALECRGKSRAQWNISR